MKLNYTVNFDKKDKDKNENIELKNRTKLSMQSTVSSALASKLPSNPVPISKTENTKGWGKNN